MKKMILTLGTALTLMQSTNAFAKNKQDAGTIIGGVVGAIVGSEIGNGSAVGTAIGAIAGATIGSSIGRDLDELDRREMEDAQRRALERGERNRGYQWRGHRHHGNFYVTRVGYYQRSECRSYRSEIYTYSGHREIRSGTTCYGSNGWYEVHERYVSWY
ncbi:MAG: hypothetical protein BroJett040_10630 [Oligoflexia bacterium]|nr:MAG: hypothetical protein BroJett040_10630 [Oligoflexia bacterium]